MRLLNEKFFFLDAENMKRQLIEGFYVGVG